MWSGIQATVVREKENSANEAIPIQGKKSACSLRPAFLPMSLFPSCIFFFFFGSGQEAQSVIAYIRALKCDQGAMGEMECDVDAVASRVVVSLLLFFLFMFLFITVVHIAGLFVTLPFSPLGCSPPPP